MAYQTLKRRDHCSAVTSYDCEAPAGYAVGGASASAPRQPGLFVCAYCEEPVCGKCASDLDGKMVCDQHEPEELLTWLLAFGRPRSEHAARIAHSVDASTPESTETR